MKIAVINEVSARDKNKDIIAALDALNLDYINVGMSQGDASAELTYIHTGLMAGILLNLGAVDTVIGGCGTGEGFMISAMQYPKVFCGLISEPLGAWLFGKINGGNCISLALNYAYGWAGNINLKYIFEKLFQDAPGTGYPPERAESQGQSREQLNKISLLTHRTMREILESIDKDILETVLLHKPLARAVTGAVKDLELQSYLINKIKELS